MAKLYHNVHTTLHHCSAIILLRLIPFIFLSFSPTQTTAATLDVLNFGAIPDGLGDSTTAFAKVWVLACNSNSPTIIHIPSGSFLIHPILFTGPCRNSITLWLDGTIVTDPNYEIYTQTGYIMQFYRVTGLLIRGGTIDARGKALWDCRIFGHCSTMGAASLMLVWCTNVEVRGFTSLDSYRVHIDVFGGQNVRFRNTTLIDTQTGPNTGAGFYLSNSNTVTIFNSAITVGDDCITIGPSSSNFRIQRITCGPGGHGISIGSLANSYDEGGVEDITISGVVFTKTLSGVMIKTLAKPSKSYVKNVLFKNIVMKNVNNPILIDQKYCTNSVCFTEQTSGVKISNITYQNIKGTSSSQEAVKFDCSPSNGCKRIRMRDIFLIYNRESEASYSTCKFANGFTQGNVLPDSCL